MQKSFKHSLVGLRRHQVLRVVVFGHDLLHNGHQTPKGPLLLQDEESDGCQPVEPLAVSNIGIPPTECNQNASQFLNLAINVKYFLIIFSII